jgi:hypothetical protein
MNDLLDHSFLDLTPSEASYAPRVSVIWNAEQNCCAEQGNTQNSPYNKSDS